MFNSREKRHRNPVGAVPDGRSVHFKILLPRELSCREANLIMEQENGAASCLGMFWCGMEGADQEWWECHFTPDAPGLYFYHFEITTCRGRLRLSRGSRQPESEGTRERLRERIHGWLFQAVQPV